MSVIDFQAFKDDLERQGDAELLDFIDLCIEDAVASDPIGLFKRFLKAGLALHEAVEAWNLSSNMLRDVGGIDDLREKMSNAAKLCAEFNKDSEQ